MRELVNPSVEIAARILREVSYEERLGGYMQSVTAGSIPYELYSLEAVVNFLRVDPLDVLLMLGTRSSMPYIDLPVLARWVEEVLGDADLAEGIRAATSQDEIYVKQVVLVKELLEQRLEQCIAAVEKEKELPETDIKSAESSDTVA